MKYKFTKLKAIKLLLLFPLLLALNCSAPTIYPQHVLSAEILSARPGHDGKLTNRACIVKTSGGVCTKDNINEYDISDANFRSAVNELGFVCKIGGRRFKICKDKPGFCRITYIDNCSRVLGICISHNYTEQEEYISADPYSKVLALNPKCFNPDEYSWEAIE